MPGSLPKDHDYIELFDMDEDTSETDEDSDPELSSLRPKHHHLDGGLPSSSSSVSLTSPGIYLSSNASGRLSTTSVPLFHQPFDIERAGFGEKEGEPEIGDAKSLALQSLPSLLISVAGLVFAGWLLDALQHWTVFLTITELFILVPVLLNLKGNLEMNLAARFSTSANLGDLDYRPTRHALVTGNLALLQVQALIVGSIAGLFSFAMGTITHPKESNSYFESMLMITSAMLCAAISSLVLGTFMCGLVILCRWARINPDNIACPLASSLGDVITLIILATVSHGLMIHMDTFLSTGLFAISIIGIPVFATIVWRNKLVKELLFSGWTPILVAMVISSLAGLVLERYVERYKGLALLVPVLCGLAGNLGSVYASRISTCLHAGKVENYARVEWTLLLMNIPVQAVFLIIAWGLDLGHMGFNWWFVLVYFVVSMVCSWLALFMGKQMTLACWKWDYDPDNYVLPYLTAIIDVVGTTLLVASFATLNGSGLANMEITPEST